MSTTVIESVEAGMNAVAPLRLDAPVLPVPMGEGWGEGALPRPTSLAPPAGWASILADYFELTKPKISVLVLVTVAVAMFVAGWGAPAPWLLLHTLVGTALVAASASALNQRWERRTDALMDRTLDRPLPAGRITEREALAFGAATIVTGLVYLAVAVNWLTAGLGAITWVLYVAIYTPLKRISPFNTVVGAVAGALPTLMGWSAVGGSFELAAGGGGLTAATLFMIVYLWQFPHFMAIAWIYRRQYAAAGLKMLTVVDPSGLRAGRQAVNSSLALVPVSLVPVLQQAGPMYFAAAIGLGLVYFICSVQFFIRRDDSSARWLLRASLIHLPALLLMLLLVPFV